MTVGAGEMRVRVRMVVMPAPLVRVEVRMRVARVHRLDALDGGLVPLAGARRGDEEEHDSDHGRRPFFSASMRAFSAASSSSTVRGAAGAGALPTLRLT